MKTVKSKTAIKPKAKAPVATASKPKKATPAAAPAKAATAKVKKSGMDLADIKAKAQALGLIPGKLKKAELILAIQSAEKNTPCFGSGTPACPHMVCCWRIDCII